VRSRRTPGSKHPRSSSGPVSPLRSMGVVRNGQKESLADRVYRTLKRDIVRGVYQPGEPISENQLARRYKGSRTPVREAAVRLQKENLLRIVPKRGYFVCHMSVRDLNEIYEYRASIEGACAELAASKGVSQDAAKELDALAKIGHRTDDRDSYISFIEADTLFHVGIARLTHNRLLVSAVEDMRSQTERIMYAGAEIGYYGDPPVHEHREILAAIKSGNGALARRLMHEHIVAAKERLTKLAMYIPVGPPGDLARRK
jgi:DNA-binding GntR family transcriptional regulator